MNLTSHFENRDIEAIRIHLGTLPPLELKAIILRYWGSYSIEDIASEFKKSWEDADLILERGVNRLRQSCYRDPVLIRHTSKFAA